MNSISELIKYPFLQRDPNVQVMIKNNGRPTPPINLTNIQTVNGKTVLRKFNPELYTKHEWLCGSDTNNNLYCFPCVLFNGDKTWSSIGYKDLIHLSNAITKHELNPEHIHNVINLEKIGTKITSNETTLKKFIQTRNIEIEKNLQVLDLLISCIKFCAKCYIPIFKKNFDEEDDEINEDIDAYNEILELVSGPNNTLKNYLKMELFKNEQEKMRIDIIHSAFEVYQEEILNEIAKTDFVSLIIEDIDNETYRKVIILRYVINEKPVERIWKILNEFECNSMEIILENELEILMKHEKHKLISQSYREINLNNKIHEKIQTKYPNSNLVHIQNHTIKDIICSSIRIKEIRIFLAKLTGIIEFFKNTKEIISTPYDFENNTNNEYDIIYTNKNEILAIMLTLQESFYEKTSLQTSYLIEVLQDEEFLNWLEYFHTIIQPTVEKLINEYENCLKPLECELEPNSSNNFDEIEVKLEEDIDIFHSNIIEDVKMETNTIPTRKRKLNDEQEMLEGELLICLKSQLEERLKFRGHTFAGRLFDPKYFEHYTTDFPESFLEITVGYFSNLNSIRLRAELEVIYSRIDYRNLSGPCELLGELVNIKSTFQETVKLLNIILTIPAKSDEVECCFNKLNEVEYFLNNTKDKEYSQFLIVLSCEKQFVEDIFEFNEKVVEIFAKKPGRIEHFKRQEMLQ